MTGACLVIKSPRWGSMSPPVRRSMVPLRTFSSQGLRSKSDRSTLATYIFASFTMLA
jgi:hypothetical protein